MECFESVGRLWEQGGPEGSGRAGGARERLVLLTSGSHLRSAMMVRPLPYTNAANGQEHITKSKPHPLLRLSTAISDPDLTNLYTGGSTYIYSFSTFLFLLCLLCQSNPLPQLHLFSFPCWFCGFGVSWSVIDTLWGKLQSSFFLLSRGKHRHSLKRSPGKWSPSL